MAEKSLGGSYDVVVVGSGPNGLAAAVRMAQNGSSVLVLEAEETIGGGARSAELTLPGCMHDVCSAVHPMGVSSPFFRQLPLSQFGLTWVEPELPLAHPLGDDRAAVLFRSVTQTAEQFGTDRATYERVMAPLISHWEKLTREFMKPLLHVPRHPLALGRFGLNALRSAAGLVQGRFRTEACAAMFAGLAAHSFLPLEQVPSAAFGLVLGMIGHAVGWPFARGGSQQITDALAALLRSLGGEVRTGHRVKTLGQLPKSRVTLLDITPRQLLRIAGDSLPPAYRRKMERFRYGPGIFKADYVLDGPIPWRAQACRRAGTVHVGGSFEEIAAAERAVVSGEVPQRPFVLLAQPTLADKTRAPAGKHILWAYCHVPSGSSFDMTQRIEQQIERFAPGFRDRILARRTTNCAELESKNSNLVGGAIDGGMSNLRQLLARPVLSFTPYRTPIPGVYLCSASTPPGGGVHGMCGFNAAEAAIRDCLGRERAAQ